MCGLSGLGAIFRLPRYRTISTKLNKMGSRVQEAAGNVPSGFLISVCAPGWARKLWSVLFDVVGGCAAQHHIRDIRRAHVVIAGIDALLERCDEVLADIGDRVDSRLCILNLL